MFHIQGMKVYLYHAEFSAKFLHAIQSGEKVTETATIHRYPKDGHDLRNVNQRKDLYLAMFNVLKYITSGKAQLNFLLANHKVCMLSPIVI